MFWQSNKQSMCEEGTEQKGGSKQMLNTGLAAAQEAAVRCRTGRGVTAREAFHPKKQQRIFDI